MTALAILLVGCGGGVVSYENVFDAGPAPAPDADGFEEVTPDGCEHVVGYDARLAPIRRGDDRVADHDAPVHVHLSFPADPASTIAFTWQTDPATRASDVEIGTKRSALDRRATGYTFFMRPEGAPSSSSRRIHEVHVCGLDPDTTYFYRVGYDHAWSEVGSFRTAPLPGTGAPVTFAVIGDARDNHDVWEEISRAVEPFDVDFVVFTGDAVNWGNEQEDWDGFFEYGASLLASTVFMPVNGNHEANEMPYYAQFALPGNEQWFEMRYGDLQFVYLNDSPADPESIENEQRTLLDELLADPEPTWRFAVHHKPPYSSGSVHGPNEALQSAWGSVFDARHLDVDLAGHEHVYERTHPIFEGFTVPSPAEGTVYTTNGGAGAVLYGIEGQPWTNVIESVHGFTIVHVEGRRLDWQAFRQGGDDLDSFAIEK